MTLDEAHRRASKIHAQAQARRVALMDAWMATLSDDDLLFISAEFEDILSTFTRLDDVRLTVHWAGDDATDRAADLLNRWGEFAGLGPLVVKWPE